MEEVNRSLALDPSSRMSGSGAVAGSFTSAKELSLKTGLDRLSHWMRVV